MTHPTSFVQKSLFEDAYSDSKLLPAFMFPTESNYPTYYMNIADNGTLEFDSLGPEHDPSLFSFMREAANVQVSLDDVEAFERALVANLLLERYIARTIMKLV